MITIVVYGFIACGFLLWILDLPKRADRINLFIHIVDNYVYSYLYIFYYQLFKLFINRFYKLLIFMESKTKPFGLLAIFAVKRIFVFHESLKTKKHDDRIVPTHYFRSGA